MRLADPADPHQAWIVSTRRPGKLAAIVGEYIVVPGSPSSSENLSENSMEDNHG
ncbi:hypothetical protein JCM18918_61 [Cutibacterium acnes JCM 18918]|nr:hypothetical protein JCM18918_61 [Cutibacterium acnes JCM 18918]